MWEMWRHFWALGSHYQLLAALVSLTLNCSNFLLPLEAKQALSCFLAEKSFPRQWCLWWILQPSVPACHHVCAPINIQLEWLSWSKKQTEQGRISFPFANTNFIYPHLAFLCSLVTRASAIGFVEMFRPQNSTCLAEPKLVLRETQYKDWNYWRSESVTHSQNSGRDENIWRQTFVSLTSSLGNEAMKSFVMLFSRGLKRLAPKLCEHLQSSAVKSKELETWKPWKNMKELLYPYLPTWVKHFLVAGSDLDILGAAESCRELHRAAWSCMVGCWVLLFLARWQVSGRLPPPAWTAKVRSVSRCVKQFEDFQNIW